MREYYRILCLQPTLMPKFYKKPSSLSRGMNFESVDPLVGREAIRNVPETFNLEGKKIVLSTIDIHGSYGGGIILLVLGEVIPNLGNDPPKKFVQTFFLARQQNGYYILNDIFRYIKYDAGESWDSAMHDAVEERTPAADATPLTVEALFGSSPKESSTIPLGEDQATSLQPPETGTPVSPPSPPPAADDKPQKQEPQTAATGAPQHADDKQHEGRAPAADAAPTGDIAPPAQKPAAAPQKPSYASLVADGGPPQVATQVPQQHSPIHKRPLKKFPANGSSSSYPNTQTRKEDHPRQSHKQGDHYPLSNYKMSVFVRGVPSGLAKDKLEQLVSRFGPLRSVTLTSNLMSAFVEFESSDSVEKAIGSKIEVDGSAPMIIEERKKLRSSQYLRHSKGHPRRGDDSQDLHSRSSPKQHRMRSGPSSASPATIHERPVSSAPQAEAPSYNPAPQKPPRSEGYVSDSEKHHPQQRSRKPSTSGLKKIAT